MVLFTSLMLAPELFVPISVIAYLYLSLTYAGYPTLVKMLVPKKYRGIDIIFDAPEIPKTKKFNFHFSMLCFVVHFAADGGAADHVLLPGYDDQEAEIVPYQDLLEKTLSFMLLL